jgi:hypothetical protein
MVGWRTLHPDVIERALQMLLEVHQVGSLPKFFNPNLKQLCCRSSICSTDSTQIPGLYYFFLPSHLRHIFLALTCFNAILAFSSAYLLAHLISVSFKFQLGLSTPHLTGLEIYHEFQSSRSPCNTQLTEISTQFTLTPCMSLQLQMFNPGSTDTRQVPSFILPPDVFE